MNNKKTHVDFHCHISDAYDISYRNGAHFYGFLQRTKDFGQAVLDKTLAQTQGNQANAIAGIVNFDDDRARGLVDKIKREADSRRLGYYQSGPLLVINTINARLGFIASQELVTDRGDVLFVGVPRNIKSRKLGDALMEAKDLGALRLGCHINGVRSLNSEDIKEYWAYFNGVDRTNMGLPVYAASDSHTVQGMFKNYTLFENLDLSGWRGLRESIEGGLRFGNTFTIKSGKGLGDYAEMVRHLASVGFVHGIGLPLGLMKRETK